MKDSKPVYTYNFLGLERFNIAASQPLLSGNSTIRYEFAYGGGGLGKGVGTLLVNGQKVAEGRIERTQCCGYSADEGADVGVDEATPVTEDYKARDNTFTGKIHKVTIELKEVKLADHQSEEQARVETARKRARSDSGASIRTSGRE
jgi:arylsulfatase